MHTEGTSGLSRTHSAQSQSSSVQSAHDSLRAASLARVEAAQAAARASLSRSPVQARVEPVSVPEVPAATLAQRSAMLAPPPSVRELAAMAQAVYTPGARPPDGWSIASPAQLAEIGLSTDMLTSPSSDFRAEVYVREVAGQPSYTVAFRGSQSASDWQSNLGQGVGLKTDHYNRALALGDRLDVPAGTRVTITGHSLGGGLASAAALAAERDAVTFNAAGLSNTTLAEANRIAGQDGRVDIPDIRAMYVRGEVLSALQDGGDRVAGGIIGGIFGGFWGGAAGAAVTDLPEAVGTRIALDPVRPEGMRWYQDNPVAKHMMDYVIASLPN